MRKLLESPLGEPHPLLAAGSITLAAWKVSGREADNKGFRKGLPRWSQEHGGRVQHALTMAPGTGGLAGVVEGKSIRFKPLWGS